MEILTVNVGSSSVRLAGYRTTDGVVEPLGRLRIAAPTPVPLAPHLATLGIGHPGIIAHRVVHGGSRLVDTCLIDTGVEVEIARLAVLAPLHNATASEWIAACRLELPDAKQVAVFDTAFFAALPEAAASYALPRELCRRLEIRRFGFHGIAHRALWTQWQTASGRNGAGKLVSLQLGSGCSAAAIHDGAPLDTSMGMTPLEGLVMGTRAGDVDPGVLLQLLRDRMTPTEIDDLLNCRSGLLGLSGTRADVRELLCSDQPAAAHAVDVYCHRARKYVGAYLAVLGGTDAIVFGGGVGEHEPEIRRRICEAAVFCGLQLDDAANQRGLVDGQAVRISAAGSSIEVWIIPVDEEALIAAEAWALTKGRP